MNGIIKNNKLTQVIEQPTRVTPTSATLLDLIIANKPNFVLCTSVVPGVISDHDLISVNVNVGKPKRQLLTKTFRHLGQYSKDSLCQLLLSQTNNFNQIKYTDNVDLQLNIFNENFIKCLDTCAPVVTKEISRSSAPWLNDDLRLAMQKRDDVRNRLKRDRFTHLYSNNTRMQRN